MKTRIPIIAVFASTLVLAVTVDAYAIEEVAFTFQKKAVKKQTDLPNKQQQIAAPVQSKRTLPVGKGGGSGPANTNDPIPGVDIIVKKNTH